MSTTLSVMDSDVHSSPPNSNEDILCAAPSGSTRTKQDTNHKTNDESNSNVATAVVQLTVAQLEELMSKERLAVESMVKREMELRLNQEREERQKLEEMFKQQQEEMKAKIEERAEATALSKGASSGITTNTSSSSSSTPKENVDEFAVNVVNRSPRGSSSSIQNHDQFPVTYCHHQGHLLVSSTGLQFICNGGISSIMWEWKNLGKISTTTTTDSNIMRIDQKGRQQRQKQDDGDDDDDDDDLVFQFETAYSLAFAATKFQHDIREAKSLAKGTLQTRDPTPAKVSVSPTGSGKTGFPSNDDDDDDDETESLVKRVVQKEMELSIIDVRRELTESMMKTFVTKESITSAAAAASSAKSPGAKQEQGQPLLVQDSTTEVTHLFDAESSLNSPPPQNQIQQQAGKQQQQQQQQQHQQQQQESWYYPFGESVYTLLYLCEFQSQGFWYGIFIYAIQIATICLTLRDIFFVHYTIPPMVDQTVTFAQALTIFMLVAYMSDLIEAVQKLHDGFYPEVLWEHPGATYATWLISCLAQLSAGLLLLAASFILTMQSDTVIALMLNLTALLFMAEIDDIGFAMAKMGFITDQLQKEAENVVDFKVPKRDKSNVYKRVLYFLAFLGLFCGYSVIKVRQIGGYYLPTNLYVQFGDAYNAKFAFYSGLLTCEKTRTSVQRVYHDATEKIFLGYCVDENAWTFSEGSDPCDYFAKSYETYTYDVTSLLDSGWEILDSFGRLQPFDSFSLANQDCNEETCQGECISGLCHCPHDRFGFDCQFDNPCPDLILNRNLGSFPATKEYGSYDLLYVASELEVLRDNSTGTNEYVRIYNMPVYYSTDAGMAPTIIFFAGRRWIITKDLIESTADEGNNASTAERAAAVLKDGFHGHHNARYTPLFFSDPVDFGTPDFQPAPSGLGWWSASVLNSASRNYVPGLSVDAGYICRTCYEDQADICGAGTCSEGICVCDSGYTGGNCEEERPCYDMPEPCYGVGSCDQTTGDCTCNLPYDGKVCHLTTRCDQEGGQCHNGGICSEERRCECPQDDPGLTGSACETFADCHVHGCANGGVCGLNGKCICRPPFRGILCNLVDETLEDFFCLQDSDCKTGSCDNSTGICACEDPSSYGTLCDLHYNCTWGGCLNSGTCNETTGVCDCPEPYFGPDCSQEPTCFEDYYCEETYGSGSTCNNQTGVCQCGENPWQGKGKNCDTCKTVGCFNGGLCNQYGFCECPVPYTGRYCDYLTEDFLVSSSDDDWVSEWYWNQTEACVERFGFPPYNGTDCRQQYHVTNDDDGG